MWISCITKILIVIAVSVAANTDVQDEEVAESQLQARYAKNDRPLLLIRPIQAPPKAHVSTGSSFASTLTSLLPTSLLPTSLLPTSLLPTLPKFNFDWDFLGGEDNHPKVTYKIVPPHIKKDKKEPFFGKPIPLSQLHTNFKADYDSLKHKKKYPAYNPKPLDEIRALPLKRDEQEPLIRSSNIPSFSNIPNFQSIPDFQNIGNIPNFANAPNIPKPLNKPIKSNTFNTEPFQLSDIIVGTPSSDGVNIPPHIEATLIENNQGTYHDLTGEVRLKDNAGANVWDWQQEPLKEKLTAKPASEPYEFDFGGQDILLESKPISLSPRLLPKEHFKYSRSEEYDPIFNVASDEVINIVNPPSHIQKPDKENFSPGDAINIVQAPPPKRIKKEQRRKQSSKTQSARNRHNQNTRPVFASSTPPTQEFHQDDDFVDYHQLPTPQALKSNFAPPNPGHYYEVIEEHHDDVKYPSAPYFHRNYNNIGDIEKYMEDTRNLYWASKQKTNQDDPHTFSIPLTTSKPKTKKFHNNYQNHEDVEIITESFPPKDFELAVVPNYHRSEKKPRVYNDREERYFDNTPKEERYFDNTPKEERYFENTPNKERYFDNTPKKERYFDNTPKEEYRNTLDNEATDEYFLPKREPVYNSLISATVPPTSSTISFRPSASISFGDEDGRANHYDNSENRDNSQNPHGEKSFWPPKTTPSTQEEPRSPEEYPNHFQNEDKNPSPTYLPDFLNHDSRNTTGNFISLKLHQESTTENVDIYYPSNHNYYHNNNNNQHSMEDYHDEENPRNSYLISLQAHQQKKQSEENNIHDHHQYDDSDEQNVIPLTDNYPKSYLPHHEEESFSSSTPEYPPGAHTEFKEGLKNRSPKPTFFIKITTPSPPTYKRPNPTSISCERRCIQTTATQEYLPVCGSDGRTYSNRGKLTCANNCGQEEVTVNHIGSCTPSY